jgi:DNA-binding MarR family transcriptional regulator
VNAPVPTRAVAMVDRLVSDGHEVPPMPPHRHDPYIYKILTDIDTGRPVSQRSLSKELGVALGLVNLLVRRLVSKGYIKVTTIPAARVRYCLTPRGMAEKARMSRAYLENTLRLYTETRERIRARFDEVSQGWEFDSDEPRRGRQKRLVFYGAGEVAEIAYVSLQGSDLTLVGVVDDRRTSRFFDLPVSPPEHLGPHTLNGEPFGRVAVTSLRHADAIQSRLDAIRIPRVRVFHL